MEPMIEIAVKEYQMKRHVRPGAFGLQLTLTAGNTVVEAFDGCLQLLHLNTNDFAPFNSCRDVQLLAHLQDAIVAGDAVLLL